MGDDTIRNDYAAFRIGGDDASDVIIAIGGLIKGGTGDDILIGFGARGGYGGVSLVCYGGVGNDTLLRYYAEGLYGGIGDDVVAIQKNITE